jgi:hypothetical protein
MKVVIYRSTPTTPPIRVRFIPAFIGLLALVINRHRIYVADHSGIFAGSLLQRGDWVHKQGPTRPTPAN